MHPIVCTPKLPQPALRNVRLLLGTCEEASPTGLYYIFSYRRKTLYLKFIKQLKKIIFLLSVLDEEPEEYLKCDYLHKTETLTVLAKDIQKLYKGFSFLRYLEVSQEKKAAFSRLICEGEVVFAVWRLNNVQLRYVTIGCFPC